MLEKLRLVESRYLELENMSGRPDFYDDPKKAAALLKEQRSLEPVVTAYRKYCAAQKNVEDMLEMLSMPLDPEMKELCQEELAESKAQLPRLEQELKILLLPKDPNDDKNVILEIRAGVGGEESALFAHSLYRMYAMYAEKKGWNIEITTLNETELGGVKELVCMITGQGAYSRLKFESGVHRVQRVPETESGGRVHTSTATVAMMPEVDEVSVELNPADIKMEVFRSSGAGGQHINKTSSAVRPPTRWWSASRSAVRCRTGRRPCAFSIPGCIRPSRRPRRRRSPQKSAVRWAWGCGMRRSAPIISLSPG